MKQVLLGLSILLVITGCGVKEHTSAITVGQKDGLINNEGEVLVKPVYKKLYYLDNQVSND